MCDGSLGVEITRDAIVGESLVLTRFNYTNGFAGANDPKVAVCMRKPAKLFVREMPRVSLWWPLPEFIKPLATVVFVPGNNGLNVNGDTLIAEDGSDRILTQNLPTGIVFDVLSLEAITSRQQTAPALVGMSLQDSLAGVAMRNAPRNPVQRVPDSQESETLRIRAKRAGRAVTTVFGVFAGILFFGF